MKKIAILQSNYIPWKGVFDMISMVDEFVFFDDVQYTKQCWRNRNQIKTPRGLTWLTIPVVKGKLSQKIKDTRVADKAWNLQHWNTLRDHYSNAPHFKDFKDQFEDLYLNMNEEFLCEINYKFIRTINNILKITTPIRFSNEFDLLDGQTERLLGICKDCDAQEYVSGPAAKNYFDEDLAKKENINITWMNYDGYREYSQLHPPFEHGVSILDLLFNCGDTSAQYMKHGENNHG